MLLSPPCCCCCCWPQSLEHLRCIGHAFIFLNISVEFVDSWSRTRLSAFHVNDSGEVVHSHVLLSPISFDIGQRATMIKGCECNLGHSLWLIESPTGCLPWEWHQLWLKLSCWVQIHFFQYFKYFQKLYFASESQIVETSRCVVTVADTSTVWDN